jgi:membrane associated rhomboid family serine protease
MVFPLSDDNSDRESIPWVNYSLIALNVFVFVVFQKLGNDETFTYTWSVVPERIVTGRNDDSNGHEVVDPMTGKFYRQPGLPPTPGSVYLTLLVSMFLHGGIAHIAGNMWFLWIFGDNVEDALGHLGYLIFYLVCGVLAALAHVAATYLVNADTSVPCLGASGAISGVLGGYLLLFPTRRVLVILVRIVTEVPAYVAIGTWFLFQIVSSLGMFGDGSRHGGGVAYGAHIGGFIAGLVLVLPFAEMYRSMENQGAGQQRSRSW